LHDAHEGGAVPIQCDYYAVMFDHFSFALQKNAQSYCFFCIRANKIKDFYESYIVCSVDYLVV
jgi:hypothetical protein